MPKTTKKTTKVVKGRPSKLTPEKIELALTLRDKGFSILEIAKALKVSEALLYIKDSEWSQLRQELNAIKTAQEKQRLIKVENSLFKRAVGQNIKEKRETFDPNGRLTGSVVTTKQIVGDVKAQQFYLMNKDPNNWKASPEGENLTQDGENTISIIIDD